ncbi:MAG TPA: DNA internalization-related competence protein ComEC/Rec2 [Longimicrobiales bacterium]
MIRPLTRVALVFAAALVVGLRAPPASPRIVAALVVVGACALLSGVRPRVAAGALGLAGIALGAATANATRSACLTRIPDGARLEADGFLTALPDPDGAARIRVGRIAVAGAPRHCEAEIRARAEQGAWHGAGGGAEVHVAGRWLAVPADAGSLRRPEWAGVLIVDAVTQTRPASVLRHPGATLRGRAQERIRALFPRDAGLVEALILEQRGGVDPAVGEQFARSGLAHLLAISGLHVGVIAGVLLLLGRIARLGARATGLAAIGCTLAYVLFLGAPHAAMRSALQLGLVLGMRRLQRPSDPFTPLAAVALVLLVADPLAILEPGFQLSFAGVAGIIVLRRRLMAVLPFGRIRYLQDSLATSLAATAATMPIAALHFGRVAPIGVLANLAAIPIVGAAVPALVAALAVGSIHEGAGRFLAAGAGVLLDALAAVAASAAAVPGGSVWVSRDTVAGWGAAAIAAAATAAFVRRRMVGAVGAGRVAERGVRPAVRRWVAAGAAAACLVAWPAAVRHGGGDALEIHAIDVGQGDALAVRSPDGRWILVDAGPRTESFDAGRARVVPFLLAHGVHRIEALILTHPDADHIGGAQAVLDAIDVGAVVDPGYAAGKDLYLGVLEEASRRGIRWIAARGGRVVRIGEVALRFLYPDAASLDEDAGANQVSVAFRLEYRDFRALFLGDLPAEVERTLVRTRADALRAELLKVAHHGSGTSTSDALLTAAKPEIAVISVGRHNRYGHPDPAVLGRLRRREIRILRTDRDGNVRIRVHADGRIEVSTAR